MQKIILKNIILTGATDEFIKSLQNQDCLAYDIELDISEIPEPLLRKLFSKVEGKDWDADDFEEAFRFNW